MHATESLPTHKRSHDSCLRSWTRTCAIGAVDQVLYRLACLPRRESNGHSDRNALARIVVHDQVFYRLSHPLAGFAGSITRTRLPEVPTLSTGQLAHRRHE